MFRKTLLLASGGLAGVALLATSTVAFAQQKQADLTKYTAEIGTKTVVASPARSESVHKEATTNDFVNPKVEPGKVRWHKDLAAACAASAKTGKPVLLFQMMGKLDDQFC